MRTELRPFYGHLIGSVNLNLGCAGNPCVTENGHRWINLDKNPHVRPDVVHDLVKLPLPFEDSAVDFVMAIHVMEHVPKPDFLPLIADLHRILKPGGNLLALTPYGTSDDALCNPMHHMGFTEDTWMYVLPQVYQLEGNLGYRADENYPIRSWEVKNLALIPYDEFRKDSDEELEFKKRHWRNVIREMHVHLRAIK